MTTNLTESELESYLRPELRNRIDEIIKFNDLGKEVVKEIVEIHLARMIENLSKQGINCRVNGGIREHLINNGYEPEYGARPIKRLIRRDILSEISKYMLKNPNTDSIHLDYDKKLVISN
tara:strand:- start:88 stop:447 length:360 start_codon:yes stop_codon:yes gene_type:complete